MTPNVTIISFPWGKEASCSCGWQTTVLDPTPAGDCQLMAMVDAHLDSHRRSRGA